MIFAPILLFMLLNHGLHSLLEIKRWRAKHLMNNLLINRCFVLNRRKKVCSYGISYTFTYRIELRWVNMKVILIHILLWGTCSCNGWNHWVDSTDISATTNFVVSLLSPRLTPRVLYDPEWFFFHSNWSIASRTITYQQDTVIQMLRAYVWTRYSSNVCLHENRIDSHCIQER